MHSLVWYELVVMTWKVHSAIMLDEWMTSHLFVFMFIIMESEHHKKTASSASES